MARIFPDIRSTRVIFSSRAEEQIYQLCQEKLGDDWQVYYSCTLSMVEPGEGLRDNEIDFVLYHRKLGAIVIEVKGGQIKFDAQRGEFFSMNRHGETFSIKNPFQQALNWKSRFLRFLKKNHIKVPVSHLVCFPTVQESDFPATAAIEPSLLLGRTRLQDFEKSLFEIVQQSQPEKFLAFADVGENLHRVLAGFNFATRLFLKDYLKSHELRMKDVEVIHETLITPVAGMQRLAVEGEAGTGKTMLAIMLAKHYRDSGQSVLILSSNPLLNVYLKKELGEGVDVETYGDLGGTFGVDVLKKPGSFEGSREDWIQYEGPDRLKKAIQQSNKRYDVLLCDEAQDVQPFWWEAIETILKDPEQSRFYVFFDRSQGVFGSGGSDKSFVPEDVLPIKPPYFPLVHNYRSTREIAGFSRAFRTGKEVLKSHSGRLGYLPEIVAYDSPEDFRKKLDELFLHLLKKENMDPNDLTLLSARKPFAEGSVLFPQSQVGHYKLLDISERKKKTVGEKDDPSHQINVSTIASFKGLETSVGIIFNISEYNLPMTNPIMSSLMYVACTRAKHMLYIFVQKNDAKLQAMQQALDRLDKSGAMVVEGSSGDNEFVGVVTHYNPDRVGWLKVEDPAFEKGNIMFFPHDVHKGQIKNLKVGQKLVFRPRVEGYVTIACELRAPT